MTKRALITGVTGQDGAYLSQLLLAKGYDVYGAYRRSSTPNFWRLQYVGVFERINLIPVDLTDTSSILEAIGIANPDEVYNLAAQSYVAASFEQPIAGGDVTGLSVTRFLEALRFAKPDARYYQASSSEMFGSVGNSGRPLTEADLLRPLSPYAAAKLYGHSITRIYADAYQMFACAGILFNHESPIRGIEFVTRKISNAVAKIKMGLETHLVLGNMEAKRDWGYAPEYVEAMWLMLQQEKPMQLIVATGQAHSVREFVERAFDIVDLDWHDYVRTDKRFMRPLDVECSVGDSSKAKEQLGWSPKTDFSRLVQIMVEEEVNRWRRWLAGERFPWDAPNYPSEARILTRAMRM